MGRIPETHLPRVVVAREIVPLWHALLELAPLVQRLDIVRVFILFLSFDVLDALPRAPRLLLRPGNSLVAALLDGAVERLEDLPPLQLLSAQEFDAKKARRVTRILAPPRELTLQPLVGRLTGLRPACLSVAITTVE